jgi:hypothetical protein
MRARASASHAGPQTMMLAAPISTTHSCAGLTSWPLKQLRVHRPRRACKRWSGIVILRRTMVKDLDQPIVDEGQTGKS